MKAKWQNTVIDITRVSYWQEVNCNGVALVLFLIILPGDSTSTFIGCGKTLTVSFKHPLINIAGDL